MNKEELKQYCKDASLEISNMQHTIDELKNINDKLSSALTSAENKLDLYKSVIDEVREYIKNNNLYHYEYDEDEIFERIVSNKKELLEILKEDNKEE